MIVNDKNHTDFIKVIEKLIFFYLKIAYTYDQLDECYLDFQSLVESQHLPNAKKWEQRILIV